jgi:hypothetical protein
LLIIALATTFNEISSIEQSLLRKSHLSGDTLKLGFVELNEYRLAVLLSIMNILYHNFSKIAMYIYEHVIGMMVWEGFI